MPKDEILMAFVDGELGERDRNDVERLLANDQDAREKVEKFRKTRAAINAFAAILDEKIPDGLVEIIRRHDRRSEVAVTTHDSRPGNWFLLAASLVIGISLGAIGTKYYLDRTHGRELTIATAKIAGLASGLEAAEKKIKAAKEVSLTFPLSLVYRAVENGSRVPASIRRKILAELNSRPPLLSKPIPGSANEGLDISASRYENLNDLQPGPIGSRRRGGDAETGGLARARRDNILGEFSHAGKSCRLFKYGADQSPIIACKKEAGEWEIVKAKAR